MNRRLNPIIYDLVLQYYFPDVELLRQADVVEVANVLKNGNRILQLVSSEITCKDFSEAEIVSLLNQMRSAVLHSMPCIRKLLKECAEGKITKHHGEMIQCAIAANEKLKALIERSAEYPELTNIYHARAR